MQGNSERYYLDVEGKVEAVDEAVLRARAQSGHLSPKARISRDGITFSDAITLLGSLAFGQSGNTESKDLLPSTDQNEIRVACFKCGTVLKVASKYIGRKGQCKCCGEKFIISDQQQRSQRQPEQSLSVPINQQTVRELQKVNSICGGCGKQQAGFLIPSGRFICPHCDPPAVFQRWQDEWTAIQNNLRNKALKARLGTNATTSYRALVSAAKSLLTWIGSEVGKNKVGFGFVLTLLILFSLAVCWPSGSTGNSNSTIPVGNPRPTRVENPSTPARSLCYRCGRCGNTISAWDGYPSYDPHEARCGDCLRESAEINKAIENAKYLDDLKRNK